MYLSHTRSLIRQMDVKVKWCVPAFRMDARALYYSWPALRKIQVPVPINDISYASCLHELGHVENPGPSIPHMLLPVKTMYELEIAAWQWAQQRAIRWTPKMDAWANLCLSTYCFFGLRNFRVAEDLKTNRLPWQQSLSVLFPAA